MPVDEIACVVCGRHPRDDRSAVHEFGNLRGIVKEIESIKPAMMPELCWPCAGRCFRWCRQQLQIVMDRQYRPALRAAEEEYGPDTPETEAAWEIYASHVPGRYIGSPDYRITKLEIDAWYAWVLAGNPTWLREAGQRASVVARLVCDCGGHMLKRAA